MNEQERKAVRLAGQIYENLQELHTASSGGVQAQLEALVGAAQRLATIQHRLSLCGRFGLHGAATQVLNDLRSALRDLPYEVAEAQRYLPDDRPRPRPTHRDLLHELQQIEEEFEGWEFEPEERHLVVKTEDIKLEGIFLGAFEIRLDLDKVGNPRRFPPYTVVALDPHPPACNEHVTHPHVSDDHLCEGDASAPIRAALLEGRLCDFFLLVRSVLTTYNQESPYVRLDHWSGDPCEDCGSLMGEDERYYCESCEHDFCESCISSCRSCDLSMCYGCLKKCPVCEEHVCTDCLKTCSDCGEACCKSCLDDNGLCPDCQEAHEQQENDHESDQSQAGTTGQPCTTVAADHNSTGAEAAGDQGEQAPAERAA